MVYEFYDFEDFFHSRRYRLVYYAKSIVDDTRVAVDIADECILRLWKYGKDIKEMKDENSFLFSVAKTLSLNHLKNKSIKESRIGQYRTNLTSVDNNIMEADIIDKITNNIELLPPRMKEMLEMSIFKNRSDKYLADHFGISVANVHNIIEQAFKKLRLSEAGANTSSKIIVIDQINAELIKHLAKHPSKIYDLCPRKFEELVAELLKNMGYSVYLMQPTRDGGRDIIAVIKVPPNDELVTLVQCKRHHAGNKVGIGTVERFLFTIREKDKANAGWIVTTSSFSNDAKILQEKYKWQLSLKDSKHLEEWCGQYGQWHKSSGPGGLWLPNNPLA